MFNHTLTLLATYVLLVTLQLSIIYSENNIETVIYKTSYSFDEYLKTALSFLRLCLEDVYLYIKKWEIT